jgi:hypothetical protein
MAKKLAQSANANPTGPSDFNERLRQLAAQAGPQPGSSVTPQPQSSAGEPQPPAGPQTQAQPGQPTTPTQPYDFIMDAGKQPSKSILPFPSLNSTLKRVIFGVAALFILLIVLNVAKGLLRGTTNTAFLTAVAQDQQSIIHITGNANLTGAQQGLTTASQNFAATTNASISSTQAAIISVLVSSKPKLTAARLNLKVSQQLDSQLTTAAANGTYDQAFRQAMKAQLTSYMNDLNLTYNKTKGKQGQDLLKNDYAQAKLLLTQLN